MAPEVGLSFNEVMAGGFTLGATDPVAGGQAGRRAGTRLAMHARVAIPSLAPFVDDPDHRGRLDGHIEFAPLGGPFPADTGVVKLFAPTDDPNLKLMVYRMTFRLNGAAYCLDGAKHVRRQPVLHAWRDTTTLYCRLYQNEEPRGTVIGAGTLYLTPLALARQLTTFRTIGSPSIGAAISTLARFGRFFAGEVIDTYLRRRRASRPDPGRA
jgi:hypothetical protein